MFPVTLTWDAVEAQILAFLSESVVEMGIIVGLALIVTPAIIRLLKQAVSVRVR